MRSACWWWWWLAVVVAWEETGVVGDRDWEWSPLRPLRAWHNSAMPASAALPLSVHSVVKTRTGPGGCTSNQPKPASNRPSTISEN